MKSAELLLNFLFDQTLDTFHPLAPELPVWNFDGSCSYLSEGSNSDVYLHPVALYRDPFRYGGGQILLSKTLRTNNNTGQ